MAHSKRRTFSRRQSLAVATVAAVLAFQMGGSFTARANDADQAANFVRQLSEQAIEIGRADGLSDGARADKLRQLLRSNFEVDLIGRFAMGWYWQQATEAERDEYIQLFEDFVVATHASRLARFGAGMSIEGARLEGEHFAIVDGRAARGDSHPVALEWHLRRSDAGWPGSPWENGYIESFNARLRDELLNGEIFHTLKEAQVLIESWRRHYNAIRPHSSLGYRWTGGSAVSSPDSHSSGSLRVSVRPSTAVTSPPWPQRGRSWVMAMRSP